MLRMSARSLSIYLRAFLNDFVPGLLQQRSSIDEMLRIVRHEGSTAEPDVQYALIWNWRSQNSRRLIGHRGWMPGVAHTMMANEERTLGVILLSSGDITWGDLAAQHVSETLVELMRQLFDCFENDSSKSAVSRSPSFHFPYLIVSLISFFNRNIMSDDQ